MGTGGGGVAVLVPAARSGKEEEMGSTDSTVPEPISICGSQRSQAPQRCDASQSLIDVGGDLIRDGP